jgi:hypothetical protein
MTATLRHRHHYSGPSPSSTTSSFIITVTGASTNSSTIPMTLDEFLKCFEYLAESAEAVDDKARNVFKLSLFS